MSQTSNRIVGAVGVAVIIACASTARTGAQHSQNPFHDHSDNAETIHVLPPPASVHSPRDTQPTDSPVHNGVAVFPASYGSGSVIDHGGSEMSNAQFRAIYLDASGRQPPPTALRHR